MVDIRRSSRDTSVNGSSVVFKIGKAAAAAIATREKRVTDPSPNDQQAETKDWILKEDSWGVRVNNGFHLITQPMKPSYNKNNNVKPDTSNTAKDGANLHHQPAVPIKRAGPAPMMQSNKRARNDNANRWTDDSEKAERSATYTRLVKERKEVVKSKGTLREKKLKLDAEAAVLEKNAEEIDARIEKMIQNASREEIVEWLMKASS